MPNNNNESNFTKEATIYTAVFVSSLAYAPVLSWWKRAEPISYHQYTWLQTTIGVGYVLLFLKALLNIQSWIKVCVAFFFSCIPIVGRSLLEVGIQNRDFSNDRTNHAKTA